MTTRQCLAIGLAALLLCVFFVYSPDAEFTENVRYSSDLQQFLQCKAHLNENIIKLRYGLLAQYDVLVDDLNLLKTIHKRLGDVPSFISPSGAAKIHGALALRGKSLLEEEALIENLKSRAAMLNNSLRILPIQADRLRAIAEEFGESFIVNGVNDTERRVLIYNLNYEAEQEQEIKNQLELLNSGNKGLLESLTAYKMNAITILNNRPIVEDCIKQLLAIPYGVTGGIISAEYVANYTVANRAAHTYRIILLMLCVVLAASVSLVFVELRRSERKLSSAMMNLEKRVLVRTRELTSSNEKLEERNDELKHTQSQLLHAQKLESIGQLAAGIAHEINTPTQYIGDNLRFVQESFSGINKVIAHFRAMLSRLRQINECAQWVADTDLLIQETDLEYICQETPAALTQSLEGVSRVLQIVLAMKEFSHPGCSNKILVDLNRCIESTVTVARNEWKYFADVHTELDPMLPKVPCFPGEFNQVMLNMIVNACHAIEDVVGKESGKKGVITIGTRCDGACVEISIADTGTGIPEHARSRIFDPFYTTKDVGRGTGQGLAIAHSVIVDKHQGSIRFSTETGKGTTFLIRLPLDIAHSATEAPAAVLKEVTNAA